jgi:hypothetical protein
MTRGVPPADLSLAWIKYPSVCLVVGCIVIPLTSKMCSVRTFLFLQFTIASAMFAGLQVRGNIPVLQIYFYASYLIPWIVLALGALLPPLPEERLKFPAFLLGLIICLEYHLGDLQISPRVFVADRRDRASGSSRHDYSCNRVRVPEMVRCRRAYLRRIRLADL